MNIGMIFGIIFAIIVMGFLIVFAVPQIMNMNCANEQLRIAETLDNLEEQVGQVYFLSEHSITEFALNNPANVKLCLVDYNNLATNTVGGWIEPDSVTRGLIEGQQYNVWYSYCGGSSGKNINYLSIESGKSFCITGSGRVYLENKGTSVDISIA